MLICPVSVVSRQLFLPPSILKYQSGPHWQAVWRQGCTAQQARCPA